MCEINIPRDLAVQIIGSDAGRERRIRPQGFMTRDATDAEKTAVATVMNGFLLDEIERVHANPRHRPRVFCAHATEEQALALRGYCMRYAAHCRKHLEKHDRDDRHHRTQQRLNQATELITQINDALGTPFADGRSLEECASEIALNSRRLIKMVDTFCDRAEGAGQPLATTDAGLPRTMLEFRETILLFLDRIESAAITMS